MAGFLKSHDFSYVWLFAYVWHEGHEPRALDGVFDGALEGGAVATAFAAKELALAGTHFLQARHVFVIHERGARAALFRAKTAAILSSPTELLTNH